MKIFKPSKPPFKNSSFASFANECKYATALSLNDVTPLSTSLSNSLFNWLIASLTVGCASSSYRSIVIGVFWSCSINILLYALALSSKDAEPKPTSSHTEPAILVNAEFARLPNASLRFKLPNSLAAVLANPLNPPCSPRPLNDWKVLAT